MVQRLYPLLKPKTEEEEIRFVTESWRHCEKCSLNICNNNKKKKIQAIAGDWNGDKSSIVGAWKHPDIHHALLYNLKTSSYYFKALVCYLMLRRFTLTPLDRSHQLATAVESFFQNVNAEHISDANERLHIQLLDLFFVFCFYSKSLVNHIVGGSEHYSRFLLAQDAGTWWEKEWEVKNVTVRIKCRTVTNLREIEESEVLRRETECVCVCVCVCVCGRNRRCCGLLLARECTQVQGVCVCVCVCDSHSFLRCI